MEIIIDCGIVFINHQNNKHRTTNTDGTVANVKDLINMCYNMMISTMKKNTIFFWLLLFLVGILDSNISAAAVEESITTTKTNTKNNANTSIPHYSLPPCSRDERQIFVNSHNYIMCAPICTDNENCPLDVPKGITMVRMGKAMRA